MGDVHAVLHRGRELGEVLAEAAVAGDGHDRAVGRGGPRAHRGGEAEADRAEVARHQHRLARCTRSSGRTSTCCCRRRPRSPRRRGRGAVSASNTAADATPSPRSSSAAARLLGPPDRPALGDVGALVDAVAAAARQPVDEQRARSRRRAPSTGTVTGWKRPSAIGSKSTCTIGLYDAMPVWFENDAPNTMSRSRLVHQPARDRRAAAPEHAGAERVVVGDEALGLERGEHRRVAARSASATTASMSKRAPWPTTITGRLRAGDQARRALDARLGGGAIAGVGDPAASGPTPRRRRRRGQHLHLVGQHEVRDARARRSRACSARVISSAWSESASTVWE